MGNIFGDYENIKEHEEFKAYKGACYVRTLF